MIQHNITFENPENKVLAMQLNQKVEKCLFYHWYFELVVEYCGQIKSLKQQ
jgi:hypothetical protein